MKATTTGLWVVGIALASTGCKVVDKLKDAADGENDSYCEAVCDWASACADGNTDITVDEAYARCIEATEAQDPKCGGAEDGLSLDEAAILNECTADVRAMDCTSLTGSENKIMTGTPPVATCLVAYGNGSDAVVDAVSGLPESAVQLNDVQAYVTYNVARNAVLESGSEVCERFEETVCGYMTDCLIEKGGIDVGEEIEQTTTDACIDRMFGGLTDECITSGRYDSFLPIDYNLARYSAMECMDGWDDTAASGSACDVFTSTPPAVCAGAFTTADQVETLLSVAVSFAGDYDVEL